MHQSTALGFLGLGAPAFQFSVRPKAQYTDTQLTALRIMARRVMRLLKVWNNWTNIYILAGNTFSSAYWDSQILGLF